MLPCGIIIQTGKAEGRKMLCQNKQITMSLSPYADLYEIIVPQNHILRRIKDNIDFSFVNPMLRKQYCEHYGRPAKEPEMMFKLLFLKKLYDLSDERLIASAQTDMAYKYFLGLEPEAGLVDASLLTKFRKTRITEDILEDMLKETIRQAIEKGLVKSGTIIVDSTHSDAAVRPKTVTQVLRELTKRLRREIYKNAYQISEMFPEKPSFESELTEELKYTETLLKNIKADVDNCGNVEIQKLYDEIQQLLESGEIRKIRSKDDKDARFGHKTVNSTFFGYKTHMAMSRDRIITAVDVTPGGTPDGKELPTLIEKTEHNGVEIKEVLGDMAYVSEKNLDVCTEKNIVLFARTNCAVSAAADKAPTDGFEMNKDAGRLQCPAGELAIRVDKRTAKNGNTYLNYTFSKVKCKNCPMREQCRVGKSKCQTYSITQTNEKNQSRLDFENSERFREKLKLRHRIEEKNGEMKNTHGMRRADSTGFVAMRLQAYFTAFTVNIKRIATIIPQA